MRIIVPVSGDFHGEIQPHPHFGGDFRRTVILRDVLFSKDRRGILTHMVCIIVIAEYNSVDARRAGIAQHALRIRAAAAADARGVSVHIYQHCKVLL